MKQINFKKLLKDYKSGWVGFASDFSKVVVSGKTLKEARKKAESFKERIYYFPAGQSYENFIG